MAALPLVIPLLLNIRKRLSLWLEEGALLLQKHTEDQEDVVQADHTELKLIQPFKEQRGHSVVKKTKERTNKLMKSSILKRLAAPWALTTSIAASVTNWNLHTSPYEYNALILINH